MPTPSARKVRNMVISRPSQSDTQQAYRSCCDAKTVGNGRELGCGHKAARGHEYKIEVHQPENATPQGLERRAIRFGLRQARILTAGSRASGRLLERQRREQNYDPLEQSK